MKIMSFKRKGMPMFDLHFDLILTLHLVSHNFQILFFRFSLNQVARGDTYHRKKWKQKLVLRQATSLKLHRFDIGTKFKKPRREPTDISLIFKVISTSSYPHRIDVTLYTWIHLS